MSSILQLQISRTKRKIKMKQPIQTTLAILLGATTILLAQPSFASGTHAGGHGEKTSKTIAPTRTIEIQMDDTMRFTPSTIDVKEGDVVQFNITNTGKTTHEMVFGSEKDIEEHHLIMKKNPKMVHDDEEMATVKAGKKATLLYTFQQTGIVHFACLQAGHFESGMKGKVTVISAEKKKDTNVQIQQTTQAATTITTKAVVKKVDVKNQTITLKHEAIVNLDMPPMRKDFGVKNATLLENIKPGDVVNFAAESNAGDLMVTQLALQK